MKLAFKNLKQQEEKIGYFSSLHASSSKTKYKEDTSDQKVIVVSNEGQTYAGFAFEKGLLRMTLPDFSDADRKVFVEMNCEGKTKGVLGVHSLWLSKDERNLFSMNFMWGVVVLHIIINKPMTRYIVLTLKEKFVDKLSTDLRSLAIPIPRSSASKDEEAILIVPYSWANIVKFYRFLLQQKINQIILKD